MNIGRKIILGALLALCVTGCSQRFAADLTGSQEVPSVTTKATGKLLLHLAGDGKTMHFKLTVKNIENTTMAHLHLGGPGKNGPVLVWLYPSSPPPVVRKGNFSGTLAAGTITAGDLVGPLKGKTLADLASKINAGEVYVNVHNKKNPKGAIRGQVDKVQPTYTAAYGPPDPEWGDYYGPDWGYVGPWDDDEGWGDEGYGDFGGGDFDDDGGGDDDD